MPVHRSVEEAQIGDALYVTDLDGTLLRSDGTVSKFTIRVLNEALDRGMAITYCTSRSYYTATKLLRGITFHLPAGVFNGVFMVDSSGDILISKLLSREIAVGLLIGTRKTGIAPFVFGRNGEHEVLLYVKPENKGQREFIERRKQIGDKRLTPVETLATLPDEIISMNFVGTNEDLLPILDWLRSELREDVRIEFNQDIYCRGFCNLEVLNSGASKKAMLGELAARLKFPLSNVTVFGDQLNDLGMFEAAGTGITVENAHPALKSIAAEIIGTNDDDAVARYIRRQLQQTPRSGDGNGA